ncbi:MAG: hypothetical protein COA79_04760 [Planctomycetota bacterium]|nr:MAG: hypothetical protein COA79_04760 [Planctomycetota bacterium]
MKSLRKLLLFSTVALFLIGCSDFSEGASDDTLLLADTKVETSDNKKNKEPISINELEQRIFELVNQYRINNDLSPLELNEEVSKIAREHSENMAEGNVAWGHNGYSERAEMVSSIIAWEELGENLARNNFSSPALKALDEWSESHLHEENMVGSFNMAGVGVAISSDGEYFFTQIFVRD